MRLNVESDTLIALSEKCFRPATEPAIEVVDNRSIAHTSRPSQSTRITRQYPPLAVRQQTVQKSPVMSVMIRAARCASSRLR